MIKWIWTVFKWGCLLVRILPLLEEVYEQIISIIAVVNTERKSWPEPDGDLRGARKRGDAIAFIKKFKAFSGKNNETLTKIINSSYNFVFHKEK